MDFALFVLRLVIGLLFVGHGSQKLFGGAGLLGSLAAILSGRLIHRAGADRAHAHPA